MVSRGVAIQIITLNGYTSPLKDQFGKKEARDVMYYYYH